MAILIALLLGAPPLAEAAPGDLLAWAYADDVGRLVRELEQGGFGPAIRRLVAPKVAAGLPTATKVAMLAGASPNSEPEGYFVWLDLPAGEKGLRGALAESLGANGGATLNAGQQNGARSFLFADRAGVASSEALARAAEGRAPSPLSQSVPFRNRPAAQLVAHVDIGAWLGRELAGGATKRLQRIERLGLAGLRSFEAAGEVSGRSLVARAVLRAAGSPRGLLATLGGAQPALVVGRGDVNILRVSVRSVELVRALFGLWAHEQPFICGLFSVHMGETERQLGIHLERDVMGEAPQPLDVWALPNKGRAEYVVSIPVLDAQKALKLLRALQQDFPAVYPGVSIVPWRFAGGEGAVFSGELRLAWLVQRGRLLLGPSKDAVGHVAKRAAPEETKARHLISGVMRLDEGAMGVAGDLVGPVSVVADWQGDDLHALVTARPRQ